MTTRDPRTDPANQPTQVPKSTSTEVPVDDTSGDDVFGDNTNDKTKTIQSEFGTEQFYWQEIIANTLGKELIANGDALGIDLRGWFAANLEGMTEYLTNEVYPGLAATVGDVGANPRTLETLTMFGRNYLAGLDQSGTVWKTFNPNFADKNVRVSGGGTGSSRLTPEQIRQSFDLDQLARAYTDTYRGLLIDEPKNARAVAKAYVESIVANPEQKLDFQTFARNQVSKEPRYAAIYRNKPRGMSEEQFLQPYVNAASQMLRPREVASSAAGAAQMGASQQAYRENLNRQNAVTTSAPFITKFEERMQGLKGILRG